jgi:hypothetical protein
LVGWNTAFCTVRETSVQFGNEEQRDSQRFFRERRYLLATVAIAIVLTHFSKGASARYPGFE